MYGIFDIMKHAKTIKINVSKKKIIIHYKHEFINHKYDENLI